MASCSSTSTLHDVSSLSVLYWNLPTELRKQRWRQLRNQPFCGQDSGRSDTSTSCLQTLIFTWHHNECVWTGNYMFVWQNAATASMCYADVNMAYLGCLCYCWSASLQSWYAGHPWDCPPLLHQGGQRSRMPVTGYCGTSGSRSASACWMAAWGGKSWNKYLQWS